MIVPWSRGAAVLAGLLWASVLPAEYTFPPRKHSDMEARLRVEVARTTTEPGFAVVTLTLTVEGPDTLEVQTPRLEDAADAWKDERKPIRRDVRAGRATWSQVIRLKQVKPGREPVADVTLLFRSDANADWSEEKWINILREIREVPEPSPPEPTLPFSWLRSWGFAFFSATAALLVLFVWLRNRWNRDDPPLSSDLWALREIDRIERAHSSPQDDAETYHTQISYVIRRYLTERYGLQVLQQTTAEFLDAVQRTPELSAEQQILLSELFERCDLAKFAHIRTPPEECRRTAELARELVRRTTLSLTSNPDFSPQRTQRTQRKA
jgi:hypothetical protein